MKFVIIIFSLFISSISLAKPHKIISFAGKGLFTNKICLNNQEFYNKSKQMLDIAMKCLYKLGYSKEPDTNEVNIYICLIEKLSYCCDQDDKTNCVIKKDNIKIKAMGCTIDPVIIQNKKEPSIGFWITNNIYWKSTLLHEMSHVIEFIYNFLDSKIIWGQNGLYDCMFNEIGISEKLFYFRFCEANK